MSGKLGFGITGFSSSRRCQWHMSLLPFTWVFARLALRSATLVAGSCVTCRPSNVQRQKRNLGLYLSEIPNRLPPMSHGLELSHRPSYNFITSKKKGPTLTGSRQPGFVDLWSQGRVTFHWVPQGSGRPQNKTRLCHQGRKENRMEGWHTVCSTWPTDLQNHWYCPLKCTHAEILGFYEC